MYDITAIHYTANMVSDHFGRNVRKQIRKAIGNMPLVSVSFLPMDFGNNICIGQHERSNWLIYKQVLIGCKEADTKYVAMVEDDVLYPPSHFTCFRPADDTVAFNYNKWGLYTWTEPPLFSCNNRAVMSNCIANRKRLIEILEERYAKYPDPNNYPEKSWSEPAKYEHHLGVSPVKREEFRSPEPTIMFSHKEALGYLNLGRRKRLGNERATELPYWGKASEVIKLYDPAR